MSAKKEQSEYLLQGIIGRCKTMIDTLTGLLEREGDIPFEIRDQLDDLMEEIEMYG